jgi:hypothetical protein
MIESAHAMFLMEEDLNGEKPEVLHEITMKNLMSGGRLDLQDFLDRVDMLGALGRNVLISNYGEFYRLIQYLRRYTDRPIGLPLGIPSLHEIFEEKYYGNLSGGILEGLGRLFKKGVRLFVYPTKDDQGHIVEAASFKVAADYRLLYAFLLENRFIVPMAGCKLDYLGINSEKTLAKLQSGDSSWEEMVPPEVVKIIKDRVLFNWSPKSQDPS